MTDRITRADVAILRAQVTQMLPEGVDIDVSSSNGRHHIEETRDGGRVTVRSIRSGTKRETYEYLHAMREALSLARRDNTNGGN
jgi:hypothetical protein